jgi:DNA invertase Pin-like site-specific DNA recombinase
MRIGAYCRVSSDKQEDAETITLQVDKAVDWASKNNHSITLYKDDGYSGTLSIADRPALEQLMRAVLSGTIDGVYVTALDRIARDSLISGLIIRELKRKGVRLFVGGTEYDLDNPSDKLLMGILQQFSEYERSMIRLRTGAGIKKMRDKGEQPKNIRGTVYNKDTCLYTTTPEYQELVKNCHKFYQEGRSIGYITRTLHLPDNQQVRRTLLQVEWTGYTYTSAHTKNRRAIGEDHFQLKPEHLIQVERYAPIACISLDTFFKTLKMYHVNYGKYRQARSLKNCLTGVLTCKHGIAYHGNGSKPNYAMLSKSRCTDLSCRYVVKIDWADTWAIYIFSAMFFNLTALQQLATPQHDIDSNNKIEIAEIDRKLKNLYESLEDGLDILKVKTRIKELERTKKELSKITLRDTINLDDVRQLWQDHYGKLAQAPNADKREILRHYLRVISPSKGLLYITTKLNQHFWIKAKADIIADLEAPTLDIFTPVDPQGMMVPWDSVLPLEPTGYMI